MCFDPVCLEEGGGCFSCLFLPEHDAVILKPIGRDILLALQKDTLKILVNNRIRKYKMVMSLPPFHQFVLKNQFLQIISNMFR
jgi:hypothetical protein